MCASKNADTPDVKGDLLHCMLFLTKPDVRTESQKRGEGSQQWSGALDSSDQRGPERSNSISCTGILG